MGKNKNRNESIAFIGVLIIIVQLFDVAVHILSGQVEPIRIASNMLVMFWVSFATFLLYPFSQKISFAVLLIYFLLNLIFLLNNGLLNNGNPRVVFFILIALTLLLSVLLIKKKTTSK